MAHSSLRYALFWQTPVYQSYGSFLYVALRLYIHEDEKSPGSLTYQDQQTGASNFVNIDFLELFHIFLSTWHSMAYLIQNAKNQRFKSPLLPYQSILHLCLPTKKSELKKPGNGWCAWVFSGASIPFGKYGCGGRIWTYDLRVMRASLRKFRGWIAQSDTDWTIFSHTQANFGLFRPTGAPAFFR